MTVDDNSQICFSNEPFYQLSNRANHDENSVCYEELSQPYWMVLLGLACCQHAVILMDIIIMVNGHKILKFLICFVFRSILSQETFGGESKIVLGKYPVILLKISTMQLLMTILQQPITSLSL